MKPIRALALLVAAVLLAHPELRAQCAAPRPAGAPVAAPLHVDGPFFRDAAGRVVLLRGSKIAQSRCPG